MFNTLFSVSLRVSEIIDPIGHYSYVPVSVFNKHHSLLITPKAQIIHVL